MKRLSSHVSPVKAAISPRENDFLSKGGHSLLDASSHANFGLKKFSQSTQQNIALAGQQSSFFNSLVF